MSHTGSAFPRSPNKNDRSLTQQRSALNVRAVKSAPGVTLDRVTATRPASMLAAHFRGQPMRRALICLALMGWTVPALAEELYSRDPNQPVDDAYGKKI